MSSSTAKRSLLIACCILSSVTVGFLHVPSPLPVRFSSASIRIYLAKSQVFDMSSLSEEQLKNALQQRGLDSSGSRAELLDRLRADTRKGTGLQGGTATSGLWETLDLEDDAKEEEGDEGEGYDVAEALGAMSTTHLETGSRPVPADRPGMGDHESGDDVLPPEDMMVEQLPDYGQSPKHVISKRHVGWDGALQGFTLGDGTHVNVREDPRLTGEDRAKMEVGLRKEVERWQTEYPKEWADFEKMCEEAALRNEERRAQGGVVERDWGDKPEDELEKAVREVERLEKERKALELPMARKLMEWEGQQELGREVQVIEQNKQEGKGSVADSAVEDENDEPRDQERFQEYVPIDAMFRDELEFAGDDGTVLKGYLVSSKVAQKFWRRPERAVVLLLTDERGWRSIQMRKLADHMAFLTNHVVFVPDLYRGDAWNPAQDEDQAEWRARHPPVRLLQDARSAMQCLSKTYNATATGLVGFGRGAGQALSAAASGYIPVNAVVAMSPVGYDASLVGKVINTPSLVISGAQGPSAAQSLAETLQLMDGFKERADLPYMIRVFTGCHQDFVARPYEGEERQAEDAVMLGTSWLEIQLRGHGRAKLIQDIRVC